MCKIIQNNDLTLEFCGGVFQLHWLKKAMTVPVTALM